MDDDCIAQDKYLAAFARAIDKYPDVKVLKVEYLQIDQGEPGRKAAQKMNMAGCFDEQSMYQKSLFIEVGKFDERFRVAYEDQSLLID